MSLRVLPLACVLLAAAPAAAQQRTAALETAPRVRLSSGDTVLSGDTGLSGDTLPARAGRSQRMAVRGLAGSLGWAAGALGGGYAGAALTGNGIDGDVEDLTGAIFGAALGGLFGGALGAAIPEYHRECGFGARFGRGLLGSLVGSLAGGATRSMVLVPVMGGVGAAYAADC
ncbi:MAG TPA: hypothetical protein VF746_15890 [Longimicrobium sp.]|jgi:hypothetical protein